MFYINDLIFQISLLTVNSSWAPWFSILKIGILPENWQLFPEIFDP